MVISPCLFSELKTCKANTQIAWCHSARFQGYHFSLRQSLTVLWAKNWENSFSDAVAQCLSQCHSEGVSRTEDTRGFDRRCTSVLSIGPSPCPSMWVILWQCWSPSTLGIIFFLTGKNLETKEFVRHRFKNHFLQHLLYSINHSGIQNQRWLTGMNRRAKTPQGSTSECGHHNSSHFQTFHDLSGFLIYTDSQCSDPCWDLALHNPLQPFLISTHCAPGLASKSWLASLMQLSFSLSNSSLHTCSCQSRMFFFYCFACFLLSSEGSA